MLLYLFTFIIKLAIVVNALPRREGGEGIIRTDIPPYRPNPSLERVTVSDSDAHLVAAKINLSHRLLSLSAAEEKYLLNHFITLKKSRPDDYIDVQKRFYFEKDVAESIFDVLPRHYLVYIINDFHEVMDRGRSGGGSSAGTTSKSM